MTKRTGSGNATWDRIAPVYLRRQDPAWDRVSYGLWSPPEDELGLLGPVAGRRVLDLGCGGGHNAVALARQGAQVTGVDGSATMIATARALAQDAGVDATFIHADLAQLGDLPGAAWDVVLSVATLPYVEDAASVFTACARLLTPGGRLVFSLDHPLRNCFFDAEDEELTVTPVRDYATSSFLHWTFPETETRVRAVHRPVGAWCDLVTAAGLRLRRLVEPPAPAAILDATWPADGALAPLRHVPQVLIVVAAKPAAEQPTSTATE
ncbi:MAG: methyltransferase domain-containing protein [Caldilineaceae bacterium]|nr:methyltransferase domain-containing protein [Caldilineaceae bacterium]